MSLLSDVTIQDTDWNRALMLTERALIVDGLSLQSGEKRFRQWQNESVFKNEDILFGERLALDNLTEEHFRAVLGTPPESLIENTSPAWLTELQEAFAEEGERLNFFVRDGGDDKAPLGFLNLVEPVIRRARRRVNAHLEMLATAGTLPIDPQTLGNTLIDGLLGYLLNFCLMRTMVLELNVARLNQQIDGSAKDGGFQEFVEKLCQNEYALAILREYPVLARQIMIGIQQWEHNSVEFAERLSADWSELKAMFSPEADPGELVQFQAGAGDKHRDGRSVIILGFSSGLKLVYKPRSLAIDQHFQELLGWINERTNLPSFRLLKVLDRGTHGWIEFVETKGCDNQEQLQRFYERQGGYLALLYALQAVDFHYENLVASGEHPVLIDLESLFHTLSEGVVVRESDLERLLGRTMQHSVLSIGLLPQRMWASEEFDGIDMSGLGGRGGQLTPDRVPTYENIGTGAMRFSRKRITMPGSHNRPTLSGKDVAVQDYTRPIVRGFETVYSLLMEHRDELLAGPIARFAHDEIRIIARPTRMYGLMLYESFHPDLLRDALDRDRFFDRLWVTTLGRPFLKRLIPAERRDLWEGDIPIFTTYPASSDLWASDQECIKNFFDVPGLDSVRNHILQLNPDDLEKQAWFVRASMATLSMGVGFGQWPTYQPPKNAQAIKPQNFIDMARRIGDRLSVLALKSEDEAAWIGLSLVDEKNWMLVPLGIDLYNGMAGILLFLAYLGEITGEARYTKLVDDGLTTVLRVLDRPEIEQMPLGGAFDGWGSVIYLLTHLGIIWHRPELLDLAEKYVAYIPPLIDTDKQLDIIGGTAGALAVLLALYEHRPSATVLEAACHCGDYLVAQAVKMEHGIGWPTTISEQPLAGFSHGVAGIAWALSKLSTVTGESRFRDTALEALHYERSLFSEERRNWPDLREFDIERYSDDPEMIAAIQQYQAEDTKFMHAWCHGAPGVGMGRIGMLAHIDTPEIRAEIDAALHSTQHEGFGLNHSVCHGDLGNLEFLLLAKQYYTSDLRKTVYDKAAMILESMNQYGWLCGVPGGVETPGFMTGLAGMGFEMLRLNSPDDVPSILLLEGPRRA
jgi:type 2 lantibiotic biosynthesis protein LanM